MYIYTCIYIYIYICLHAYDIFAYDLVVMKDKIFENAHDLIREK
jgi:hypothetical protein